MELGQVKLLIEAIKGCTFASIDSLTEPKKGIHCRTTGASVIIFSMAEGSGYENMVRKRLAELGKNADDFSVSDLPWGERVPGTPLIYHNDRYYLQTIELHPGNKTYFVGDREVDASILGKPRRTNQRLPPGREVFVNTYALDNITKIMLLGSEVQEEPPRPEPKIRRRGTLSLVYVANDNK